MIYIRIIKIKLDKINYSRRIILNGTAERT